LLWNSYYIHAASGGADNYCSGGYGSSSFTVYGEEKDNGGDEGNILDDLSSSARDMVKEGRDMVKESRDMVKEGRDVVKDIRDHADENIRINGRSFNEATEDISMSRKLSGGGDVSLMSPLTDNTLAWEGGTNSPTAGVSHTFTGLHPTSNYFLTVEVMGTDFDAAFEYVDSIYSGTSMLTSGCSSGVQCSNSYYACVSDEDVTSDITGDSLVVKSTATSAVNFCGYGGYYLYVRYTLREQPQEEVEVSCTVYQITMRDSYGDGWNGNYLYLGGEGFDESFTLSSSYENPVYEGYASACLPDGVYFPYACGGDWPSEVSWYIYDSESRLVASGGAATDCYGYSGSSSFTVETVVASRSGEVTLKFGGRETEAFKFSFVLIDGWPEHDNGMMSTVDINMANNQFVLQADINADSKEGEIVIQELKIPMLDQIGGVGGGDHFGFSWHRNAKDREVWVDYGRHRDGSHHKNTITIPYGDLLDDFGPGDLQRDGFHSDESSADKATRPDGWKCRTLSHDDKGSNVVLCYHKDDLKVNLTSYDGSMTQTAHFAGFADNGSSGFLGWHAGGSSGAFLLLHKRKGQSRGQHGYLRR